MSASRRKSREYAVQVLFCEFFNSHQLTRAVAAVRATSIREELSQTRAMMRDLENQARGVGQQIDTTMSMLYHAAETGELPKPKDGTSYTEIKGEDVTNALSHSLRDAMKSLEESKAKLKEINACLGADGFALKLLDRFHSNESRVKEIVTTTLRHWTSDRLAYEDWAILHLGATELLHFPDIPVKVIINEYIEIAKTFGGNAESARFVNGILDQINKDHTRAT